MRWFSRLRMRILIAFILFFQVSCSGIANFITGFAGNIASDTINREVEKRRSECKK